MFLHQLVRGILVVLSITLPCSAVVVTFDDLPGGYDLTGTSYAGLTWEIGNAGYSGNIGLWSVPSAASSSWPYSQPHNVINGWGCTQIGIGFPQLVDVQGAYIAKQGVFPTTGVRVFGYRDGTLIATTPWFTNIDATPDWFAMDLSGVNRVVFESVPTFEGGGWFGMDNLTYTPEPTMLCLLALGGLLISRRRR